MTTPTAKGVEEYSRKLEKMLKDEPAANAKLEKMVTDYSDIEKKKEKHMKHLGCSLKKLKGNQMKPSEIKSDSEAVSKEATEINNLIKQFEEQYPVSGLRTTEAATFSDSKAEQSKRKGV